MVSALKLGHVQRHGNYSKAYSTTSTHQWNNIVAINTNFKRSYGVLVFKVNKKNVYHLHYLVLIFTKLVPVCWTENKTQCSFEYVKYAGETKVRKKVRTYFKSFVCLSTLRYRLLHFEPKENYFHKGRAHQNQCFDW